jgi:elongation factor G
MAQLQKRFGREVVPVQLPIGEEAGCSGVVDLLTLKAHTYPTDAYGNEQVAEVPAALTSAAEEARAKLLEMVAERDEALLEKFFAAGSLSENELASGLKQALPERKLFPVFFASSGRNQAVPPILDALVELLPFPAEVEIPLLRDDGEEVRRTATAELAPVAYVFKTVSDPYAGRIWLLRVYTGAFPPDAP